MPNWENFHNLSFVNGPLLRRWGGLLRNSSSEGKKLVETCIAYSNADLVSLNNYIAQLVSLSVGGENREGGKISVSSQTLIILNAGWAVKTYERSERTWLKSEKTLSEIIKNIENIVGLEMKSFANNASSQSELERRDFTN